MSEAPYETNPEYQDTGVLEQEAVPEPTTDDQLDTDTADRVDTAVMPDSSLPEGVTFE